MNRRPLLIVSCLNALQPRALLKATHDKGIYNRIMDSSVLSPESWLWVGLSGKKNIFSWVKAGGNMDSWACRTHPKT
jgi:hypothetical protein